MLQIGQNFRGPRLTDQIQFLELKRQGVKSVLNLERGYFDFFHDTVNQESSWVLGLQMIPIDMPFGDIIAPTKNELDSCLVVLRDKATFGPTYFHCYAGKDRSGILGAYTRVKLEGWPIDKAIDEMFSLGFNKTLYGPLGWVDSLRTYC